MEGCDVMKHILEVTEIQTKCFKDYIFKEIQESWVIGSSWFPVRTVLNFLRSSKISASERASSRSAGLCGLVGELKLTYQPWREQLKLSQLLEDCIHIQTSRVSSSYSEVKYLYFLCLIFFSKFTFSHVSRY